MKKKQFSENISIYRYTADNDGYRADVTYLTNKNLELDRLRDEDLHLTSAVKSRVIKPLIIIDHTPHFYHQSKYRNDELSLEEKKSISVKPTFVVSSKLTHIDEVTVHQNSNLFL